MLKQSCSLFQGWFDRTEFVGFLHIGFGRTCIFTATLFLATAVTYLASEDAGCTFVDDDDDSANDKCKSETCQDVCDKAVLASLRPSSLLAMVAALGGLLGAAIMPFLGAVIDYSSYRRQFGIFFTWLLMAANLVQCMVNQNTWEWVLALFPVCNMAYIAVQTTQLAYMPEVSTDKSIVLRLAAKSRAVELSAVLFVIIFVIVVHRVGAKITETDCNGCTKTAVAIARVGQILAVRAFAHLY